MAQSSTSVIGSVTEITGNVSGNGGLRVEGTVNGSVSVSGPLHVLSGASISGSVEAESLELGGALGGDIRVRGPVSIAADADYSGKIEAERVTIAEGSKVNAQLDTPFDLNLDF